MPARSIALAALLAATSSGSCLTEEPLPYLLHMRPPSVSLPAEEAQLAEFAAAAVRPAVEPVEARKPAPPVEIVTTPVGEMIFSCSIALPADALLATPAVEPPSEPVSVVFEPVVAPRPTF